MPKEVTYYLITDTSNLSLQQIRYPIEAVLSIDPGKKFLSENIQIEHKTFSRFIIPMRTPKGINNQILKLLPNSSKDKEKAFFIDYRLPLTAANRLTLYHLLLQNYKHVYLLDPEIEEQDNFSDFVEIFPDEKTIMLFEQVQEFAPFDHLERSLTDSDQTEAPIEEDRAEN